MLVGLWQIHMVLATVLAIKVSMAGCLVSLMCVYYWTRIALPVLSSVLSGRL